MTKSITSLILCGLLISHTAFSMEKKKPILEVLEEKFKQAEAAFLVGYLTGLPFFLGSFVLPLLIGFMHDDPKADSLVIIPAALVGHVLGYATWIIIFKLLFDAVARRKKNNCI